MSSSWPRMQPGQKNPFQNAPGPFIYALPNLAGTCPFSYSDTVLSCSFPGAGDSNANDAPDPNHDPDRHHCHHHHRCCHNPTVASHCRHHHHHDPPSESADSEPPTAPTEEAAPPVKELSPSPGPGPRPGPGPSVSLSPSDENHFSLGDINPSPLTEGGGGSAEQQEPQASELASERSTSTPCTALSSPTGPVFQEGSKEEGELGEEKDGKKKRHRRRRGGRRNGRLRNEHGAGSIGPRFMGLSGAHYNLWTQYAVCPQQAQAPPLFSPPPAAAAAMNHHHAWPFAGCHHHGAFVIPPNSPAPQFWTIPMAPAVPGFVGVPVVASC